MPLGSYEVQGQQSGFQTEVRSGITLEDGAVEIQYRGQKLHWHAIAERPGKPAVVASRRRKASTPPATYMPNHPWRRSYQDMHSRLVMGAARGPVSGASPTAPP